MVPHSLPHLLSSNLCLAAGAPRTAWLPWAAAAIHHGLLLRHFDLATILARLPKWQPVVVVVTRALFAEHSQELVAGCARVGARLVVVEPEVAPGELAEALRSRLPQVA